MHKQYLSTSEVAKLLGISRIAVFKKIKSGIINAKRIGRNFVVDKKNIPLLSKAVLTNKEKQEIEQAVQKTIKEYGETLRLLGKEE